MKKNHSREIERILEKKPIGAPIVKNSTPVISFGDPNKALAATVGINPSSKEFLDGKNEILPIEKKRLVDLDLLGKTSLNDLTVEDAEKIIDGCYNYFDKEKYYKKWFAQMQEFVLTPTGYSYFDGTACHLDLIQWATDPVWGSINNKDVQELLLEKDKEFFKYQISNYNFETVFLNGKTVLQQVEKLGIVEMHEVAEIVFTKTGKVSRIKVGKLGQTTFVGWGLNVPARESGMEARKALAEWLGQKNYLV